MPNGHCTLTLKAIPIIVSCITPHAPRTIPQRDNFGPQILIDILLHPPVKLTFGREVPVIWKIQERAKGPPEPGLTFLT